MPLKGRFEVAPREQTLLETRRLWRIRGLTIVGSRLCKAMTSVQTTSFSRDLQ